ncbi:RagB/SusD family nutrient uptake outer membrane protein [Labilibaculum antarcticum]|uniref:RagB/SusD family nutrient uptake outer membrane protein n=1 Tax=Labilibaculum antarcticum TaxID=1717717 RepID=A0A1Y1CQP5_9BACT|nr:RagB/SusD family nutrient uptake outer membrane protein [Labilibaculum antarcticum]BAX82600.1 RagB/SusD family nutrient uptake outer membrane protein [Labilibaculum antarcticum]
MKKIIYILLFAVTFMGCDDYLEKSPVTEQTEESFYRTEDDMFRALIAAYEPLQRNWGESLQLTMDIVSDDAYGGGGSATDGISGKKADRGITTSSEGMWSAMWNDNYAGVYGANVFLEKVDASEMSDELKTQYKGEALFLRAYYYANLVRTFENVPLITKTLATSEYSQAAAPVDEVYAQIASDLEMSITYLKDVTYSNDEKGRVTEWAPRALLARMYLFYDGVYGNKNASSTMPGDVTGAEVLTYLNEIISDSGADLLPDFGNLWGHSEFTDSWVENSIEGIFEVQFSNQGEGWQWYNAPFDIGNKMVVFVGPRGTSSDSEYYSGWGFSPATQQLYNSYEDGDLRRDYTLLDMVDELGAGNFEEADQYTGYMNKKYAGLKSQVPDVGQEQLNFPQNYISIRYSDVLLMAAEMEFHIGSNATAAIHYNKVRARAFESYSPVGSVTLAQIFEERKLEFALEGMRYWDLLRRGMPVLESAVNATNLGGIYNSAVNSAARGFWPIPSTEIALSNYKLEQNDGY